MKLISILFLFTLSFACVAQQINESEVPANVKTVALKQSNDQAITMWVLDKKRNKYIASVISNTAVLGIEISLDGKWIETTAGVLPEKMPAAVMKSVKESFPGYDLSNFFHITSPNKSPYYSVDASSDDEDLTLSLDPSGKILEKEQQ